MKVLKFYGTWCQPCKLLDNAMKNWPSISQVELVPVDIDSDKGIELAMEYGIRSVPSLVFINDGDVVAKTTGIINEATFRAKADL